MAARVTCACGWSRTYNSRGRAEANAARHVCKAADGVRRATRQYRCKRCGLEAIYENAGAAEARYWFGRHSCRKREDAMLRAAHAQAREALIDRTPKPCLHKVANHQHGQRATYVLDQCRCLPCSKANSEAETYRERQKAYGRYHKYVPAEFVRDHLTMLRDYGIGLKRVGELSGVSNGSLTKIVYGSYAPAEGPHKGRNGAGTLLRGPARRVLRATAEAIYAVEAVPANLNPGNLDRERTPAARLHLRALVALGWSQSKLATRLGVGLGNFGPLVSGDRVLRRRTVDAVEALYAQLSMTLPPETNQRERIAAARARNYAKAHGWLPPLALDEDDDQAFDLGDLPELDEAAIWRRMQGDKTVRLSKAEKAELVDRWTASGRSLNECERVTGINYSRIAREREKAS